MFKNIDIVFHHICFSLLDLIMSLIYLDMNERWKKLKSFFYRTKIWLNVCYDNLVEYPLHFKAIKNTVAKRLLYNIAKMYEKKTSDKTIIHAYKIQIL